MDFNTDLIIMGSAIALAATLKLVDKFRGQVREPSEETLEALQELEFGAENLKSYKSLEEVLRENDETPAA